MSHWVNESLGEWVIEWMGSLNEWGHWWMGWLNDWRHWWMSHWVNESLGEWGDWMTEGIGEWVIGWMSHWVNGVIEWIRALVNESLGEWSHWVNGVMEWMRALVNESLGDRCHWMNEGIGEWVIGWMGWLNDWRHSHTNDFCVYFIAIINLMEGSWVLCFEMFCTICGQLVWIKTSIILSHRYVLSDPYINKTGHLPFPRNG